MEEKKEPANQQVPEQLKQFLSATPARIMQGRSGYGYKTATQLKLRFDHAAARDAVHQEIMLSQVASPESIKELNLFEVKTRAVDKSQYLMRPDLGRSFSPETRNHIRENCPGKADFQLVIGDGLSAAAVAMQVPGMLSLIRDQANAKGWSFGRPFMIRYCRVGILNEIGELLDPGVVVLLIGERPGLATAESLSAYMAYKPRPGHTDADRNLISNIHQQGVSLKDAVTRIFHLAGDMFSRQTSGVTIKENFSDSIENKPLSLVEKRMD